MRIAWKLNNAWMKNHAWKSQVGKSQVGKSEVGKSQVCQTKTASRGSLLKMFTFKVAMVAGIFSLSPLATAECACFCADGELKTLCTTVAEAQANPAVCPVYSAASCPLSSADAGGNSYDAPTEGAINCRDVQVWDSVRGRYVDVKACDVDG